MLETSCVIAVFSGFLALACVLEPFEPESSELRSTKIHSFIDKITLCLQQSCVL